MYEVQTIMNESKIGHIIVDGPDAVGKTTLSDYICKKYNLETKHSTADDPNDFDYHKNMLMDFNSKFYDRFFAGEYVYPKLYDRKPKLSITEIETLCKLIVETNSLYIIMNTSDVDILIRRLIERKEFNYFKEIGPQVQLFKEFAYIFESFFDKYDNFIYFDINQENAYDKLYEKIDKFIERYK